MAEKKELVDKLHEYFEAQRACKDLKLGIIALAVEHGMDQQRAIHGAVDYLDGIIAGAGSLPLARRINLI